MKSLLSTIKKRNYSAGGAGGPQSPGRSARCPRTTASFFQGRRRRPIPLKYVIKGVQGPPCRGLGWRQQRHECPQFLLLLLLAACGGKQKESKEVFRGHPEPRQRAAPFAIPLISVVLAAGGGKERGGGWGTAPDPVRGLHPIGANVSILSRIVKGSSP